MQAGRQIAIAVEDSVSYRERRELQNVIERSAILTNGRALKEAHGLAGGPNSAAAQLGLKRTTLQSRMRKYRISRQYP
jgi:transcriptional regulator with GAF, ATPase, and Fis domain